MIVRNEKHLNSNIWGKQMDRVIKGLIVMTLTVFVLILLHGPISTEEIMESKQPSEFIIINISHDMITPSKLGQSCNSDRHEVDPFRIDVNGSRGEDPSNDIGISKILVDPIVGDIDEGRTIEVVVKNYGANVPQQDFEVYCDVTNKTGADQTSYLWPAENSQNVAQDDDFTKNTTKIILWEFYPDESGVYYIDCYVFWDDENASNNDQKTIGLVQYYYFFDDMESGQNDWESGGEAEVWELGSPGHGPSDVISGTNCWGTDLDDDYPNLDYGSVYLERTIDISETRTPMLSLYHWLEIDWENDRAFVEARIEEQSIWTVLWTSENTKVSDPQQTEGWEVMILNLNEFCHSVVQLRFGLESDSGSSYAGWYIDNVGISGVIAPDHDAAVWEISHPVDEEIFYPGDTFKINVAVRNLGDEEDIIPVTGSIYKVTGASENKIHDLENVQTSILSTGEIEIIGYDYTLPAGNGLKYRIEIRTDLEEDRDPENDIGSIIIWGKRPKEVDAGGGGDYTSIQDAIDDSSYMDRIIVHEGVYSENIVVDETIELMGDGPGSVIIQGDGSDHVVQITNDRVKMSGFTIRNSGGAPNAGILITSDEVCISDVIIENNHYGLSLHGCDFTTILDSTIQNNQVGISIEDHSQYTSVNHSKIKSNALYGIDASYNKKQKVEAINNLWGDDSGPFHGTKNPEGKGNQVSDFVDFYPWMREVLYVDDNAPGGGDGSEANPFNSIQDAIDASDHGYTIRVNHGVYNGIIHIDKSINLTGNGSMFTTLNGMDLGNVVEISAEWVNVSGFRIIRSSISVPSNGAGIYVGSDNCHIFNNKVSDCHYGVLLASSNNTVEENDLSGNAYGMRISYFFNNNLIINNSCNNNDLIGIFLDQYSHNNTIETNQFDMNEHSGIQTFRSNDNIIRNNTLRTNVVSPDIYLWESLANHLEGNVMTGGGIQIWGVSSKDHWNTHNIDTTNLVKGKPVYYVTNSMNTEIPDGAGQIIIANCTNMEVKDHKIEKAAIGILVGHSSEITISNNDLVDNGVAIQLYGSSDCTVSENSCFRNSMAIWLQESTKNDINDNSFSSNSNYGMYFGWRADENLISNNTMNSNVGSGVMMYDANSNYFAGNVIKANSIGINLIEGLEPSKFNTFYNNSIFQNTDFGIQVKGNEGYYLTATDNWWGNRSGPYHEQNNTQGKGNRVSDDVLFDPWLEYSYNCYFLPLAYIDSVFDEIQNQWEEITLSGHGKAYESIIRYAWVSSLDGEIHNESYPEFSISSLSNGTHQISLKVQDNSQNWSEEITTQLIINGRPVGYIDSISPEASQEHQNITFIGHGQDDGVVTNYLWRSSIDGTLYDGPNPTFTRSDLTPGQHTILFSVQDDHGYSSMEEISSINVNGKPVAQIQSIDPNPAIEGQIISFTGAGIDEGTIVRYVWNSSIDREIFNGTESTFPSTDLTVGTHTISLRVMDDFDTWSDEVILPLTVTADTVPPQISISNPKDGSKVKGIINITGRASDNSRILSIDYRILETNEWQSASGTTNWSILLNTTQFDDGNQIIQIRASDGKYYSTIHNLTLKISNKDDDSSKFPLFEPVGQLPVPLIGYLGIAAFAVMAVVVKKKIGNKKIQTKPVEGPSMDYTQSGSPQDSSYQASPHQPLSQQPTFPLQPPPHNLQPSQQATPTQSPSHYQQQPQQSTPTLSQSQDLQPSLQSTPALSQSQDLQPSQQATLIQSPSHYQQQPQQSTPTQSPSHYQQPPQQSTPTQSPSHYQQPPLQPTPTQSPSHYQQPSQPVDQQVPGAGKWTCSGCNSQVDLKFNFCTNCGYRK